MRAAGYIRVSTTEQVEDGNSLDAQPQAIGDFCKGKGWELVEVYEDAGISGSKSDRPALQRLLEDAEAGAIDVVIVRSVDRFYRNLRGMLRAMDRLNKAGVGFVSIQENMDFTTPWGKLTLAVLGTLAEIFLDILSQNISAGKQYRASKGLTNSPHPVFGYRREDGRDLVDEETAAGVRMAFERYATGEYADSQIVELLNSKGYAPPAGARRERWGRYTVRFMLRNRYYTGMARYDGAWIEGEHNPIISQELFDAAQRVREVRGHGGATGNRTGDAYLLHRVGRCWHCGRYLYMVRSQIKQTVYLYYREPSRQLRRDCEAKGRQVLMSTIDAQVVDLVKRLQLPDDWRDRLDQLAGRGEDHDEIQDRRESLQGRLHRLRDLYELGDYSLAEYKTRRGKLQREIDSLRVPEVPEVEEAGQTLESLGQEWLSAPKRYQRDMLRIIFEGIYIDVPGKRLVCVKPYAPFVPLFRMDGLSEKEGCFYANEEEGQEAGSDG